MDQIHEVEVFRSMLIQKGVVAPDGSESALTQLLSMDASAVLHFVSHYLEQPKGAEEIAIRSAYSALERNQMLSRDLMILSLWAQFLASVRICDGIKAAEERIRNLGFAAFRRLDYQEMREMIACSRSKANEMICALRNEPFEARTKELGVLLTGYAKSRKIH